MLTIEEPEAKEFYTVSEAAAELGVCDKTVRRWFDAGKLKGYRHPINNYRMILRSDIKRLMRRAKEVSRNVE